jgi:accessory colonization factor AcfC
MLLHATNPVKLTGISKLLNFPLTVIANSGPGVTAVACLKVTNGIAANMKDNTNINTTNFLDIFLLSPFFSAK